MSHRTLVWRGWSHPNRAWSESYCNKNTVSVTSCTAVTPRIIFTTTTTMPSDEERKRNEMDLVAKMLQDLDRDIQKMKIDDVLLLATLQSSSLKDVPWLGMPQGMLGDGIGPTNFGSQTPRMGPWPGTTAGMEPLPPRLDDFSSMDPVSKRACIRRGLALPDEHLRALIHGGTYVAAVPPPGHEGGAPNEVLTTTTKFRDADYDHDEDRSTCSV